MSLDISQENKIIDRPRQNSVEEEHSFDPRTMTSLLIKSSTGNLTDVIAAIGVMQLQMIIALIVY